MIQINKIKPFKCRAYSPNGKYLGKLDYFEFNDFRIQIKNDQVTGYYMMFNDERISLDHNGRCQHWPNGFYDQSINQMMKLIQ